MLQRRKKLLIILTALGIFLISVGGIFIFEMLENNADLEKDQRIEFDFFQPNYDINILDDPEYTELNRIISYQNGSVTITVSPEEYLSTDPVLYFLAELTDTMINGKYSEYPTFFTEKYISENALPERFTMQRLYDITVEKISEELGDTGEDQFIYMLDYKISQNDGTLRQDVGSDASKPWYLAIVIENGEYKIDNILTYSER